MKIFKSFISGASIILLLIVGIVAISGRSNFFGGYHLYSVLTGSMNPTLPVSSLLVVRNQSQPFAIDDIVTFEQPGEKGRLVTHRIVAAEQTENSYVYRTKGDANPIADSWLVTPDLIKGKVLHHIPKVGALITFLNSPLGIIVLVLLPILLLAYQDIFAIHKALFEWQAERKAAKSSHA